MLRACRPARLAALLVAFCALGVVSGCTKKSELKLVPVRGKVLWNGEPLEGAHVNFYSDGKNLALAVTDEFGEFELETRERKGAVVGKHRVAITKHEPPVDVPATNAPSGPMGGGKGGKKGGKGGQGGGAPAPVAETEPADAGDEKEPAGPAPDDLVSMVKGKTGKKGGSKGMAMGMSIPDRPSLIPWKYAKADTSEIEIDVPEEGKTDVVLNLEGAAGGAPPPPRMNEPAPADDAPEDDSTKAN